MCDVTFLKRPPKKKGGSKSFMLFFSYFIKKNTNNKNRKKNNITRCKKQKQTNVKLKANYAIQSHTSLHWTKWFQLPYSYETVNKVKL